MNKISSLFAYKNLFSYHLNKKILFNLIMTKQTSVNGYSDLKNYLNTLNPEEKPVFILFTGNKSEDGQSWCGKVIFYSILN